VEELRGLARLEGLEVLDMSDIIASKPEQVALETLQIVCDAFTTCPLKEVNVSDNALGEKGIGPCRGVLENQPALERLFICNNGMSAYAASVVRDYLLGIADSQKQGEEEGSEKVAEETEGESQPTKKNTQLRTFHFFNNMSGDGGASAIGDILEHSPLLTDVRFSSTRASAEGCNEVYRALSSLTSLESLDLSDNNFDEESLQYAELFLQANASSLRSLFVKDNNLSDEQIKHLLNSISSSSISLRTLDLSGNEWTKDGFEDCLDMLSDQAAHLHTLRLNDSFDLFEVEEDEEDEEAVKTIALLGEAILPSFLSSESSEPITKRLSMNDCGIRGKDFVAFLQTAARLLEGSALTLIVEADGNCFSAKNVEKIEALTSDQLVVPSLEENDEDGEDEEESEEDEDVDALADELSEKLTT
jgi:Ran GTPase-activating protein 1